MAAAVAVAWSVLSDAARMSASSIAADTPRLAATLVFTALTSTEATAVPLLICRATSAATTVVSGVTWASTEPVAAGTKELS